MAAANAAVSLLGITLFLILVGASTFAAPLQGHALPAGIDAFAQLPSTFGDAVLGILFLGVIAFNLIGNALLGIAIWRSGSLPKWTGGAWVLAALFMCGLGIVYSLISGSQSTPPTVLIGAGIIVIAGGWITRSAARSPLVPATV